MATMEQRMIVWLKSALGAEQYRLLSDPLWDGDLEAADAAARVALRSALDVVDPQDDRVQQVAAELRSMAALVETRMAIGGPSEVTPGWLRRLAAVLRTEPVAADASTRGHYDEATGLVSGGLVASCSTCGGPHYSCGGGAR